MSNFTQLGNNMYHRPQLKLLNQRLLEPVRRINILSGPRQVGKTTIVEALTSNTSKSFYISVDAENSPVSFGYASSISPPVIRNAQWLTHYWNEARSRANTWLLNPFNEQKSAFVFAVDEIQKIDNWSEAVKGLWDQDRASGIEMHVVLLGSAPILMQKGLTESLAGRFETIHASHWSYQEMHQAFDYSLEQYIFFGGYPGSAAYINDETRWRTYMRQSLIQPNIEKDIINMVRIKHPNLLKQLFELGCHYSGRELALNKMIEVLNEAKHTETLADYLALLQQVKLLAGLHKYSMHEVRKRNSVPKLQVFNTGLMSAMNTYSFSEAKADRSYWGRLVESAIGAHLLNERSEDTNIGYWRDGTYEVDFVISQGRQLTAVEVKSSADPIPARGLEEFCKRNPHAKKVLVGGDGIAIAEFLTQPAEYWLG